MKKSEVNPARSIYYGLLSKMFVFTPDDDRYDGVVEVLETLIENPLDDNSKEALKEVKEYIEAYGYGQLAQEYDDIFHNPETVVVRDTASYYDEGVESGKKRVEVLNFLAKTRIRRNEKVYKENEDSIGFLMTFMHELIEIAISGNKAYQSIEHCLFDEIINQFIDEFTVTLYEHEAANAYRSMAVVLNAFMEFERFYFGVTRPKSKEIQIGSGELHESISEKEEERRRLNRIKRNAEALLESCSLEPDESDDAGIEDMSDA